MNLEGLKCFVKFIKLTKKMIHQAKKRHKQLNKCMKYLMNYHLIANKRLQQETRLTRPIKENDFFYLKSIINPGVVLAKGYVYSIDAPTVVGGEELGANWCEVCTQVALNPNERLIRSHGIFKTVGDSIGASIAWPMTLVERDDED